MQRIRLEVAGGATVLAPARAAGALLGLSVGSAQLVSATIAQLVSIATRIMLSPHLD